METVNALEDTTRRIKKEAFLAAYSELGIITAAAESVGIARSTHYRWLEEDPDYPALFTAATEQAVERLEQEARRRAVEGVEKAVWYQGKEVGKVREYSDTLLIFLLKGVRPEKYADRIHNDLTVTPGQQQKAAPGDYQTLRELKEQQAKEQQPDAQDNGESEETED